MKSNRWTMSALSFMLDTAAVNAITIAGQQDGASKPDTRDFRFALVKDLVVRHMKRRMVTPGMQTRIIQKGRDYLGKTFSLHLNSQYRYLTFSNWRKLASTYLFFFYISRCWDSVSVPLLFLIFYITLYLMVL